MLSSKLANTYKVNFPNKTLLFLGLNRGRKPNYCSSAYVAEISFNRTVYVLHTWHLLQLL